MSGTTRGRWPSLVEFVLAAIAPGWGMRSRRRMLALACLSLGVAFPLVVAAYTVASGRNWVALTLDTRYLGWVLAALVVAIVARGIALIESWNEGGRPTRPAGREWMSIAAAVLLVVPLAVGVVQVGRARASIAPAFVAGPDGALFDAGEPDRSDAEETPETTVDPDLGSATTTTVALTPGEVRQVADDVSVAARTTTTAPPPTLPPRPRSGIDPADLADVHTTLLLGGDAGPGRVGLRTDTMMLFSVHQPSGRAALVSLPRDMRRLLFPPDSAMGGRFPYGFTDLTNAVYPYVNSRASLRDAYAANGVSPGVVALAHGIGYSLDVTIDDYVMVDMQGFIDLIDAVGGVTVYVPKEVPMPGNVPGAPTQYPDTIGPGTIEMDGSTALGYVRSRKADNDFYRTARQRALLAALATQIAPEDVLVSFDAVTQALGATLRTSLTPDELAETLNVIGGETAIVESVGLVPPLTDIRTPDFQRLAEVVGAVQTALVTGVPSGY